MKELSKFKKLSKEELQSVLGGAGGGWYCKNGTSSGSSLSATYQELRSAAEDHCKDRGGVSWLYYLEDEEEINNEN